MPTTYPALFIWWATIRFVILGIIVLWDYLDNKKEAKKCLN